MFFANGKKKAAVKIFVLKVIQIYKDVFKEMRKYKKYSMSY